MYFRGDKVGGIFQENSGIIAEDFDGFPNLKKIKKTPALENSSHYVSVRNQRGFISKMEFLV
jgi:hypothetical protein